MTKVFSFTVSPFMENTYIVTDDTKECIIFDPGCYTDAERATVRDFIKKHELNPVRLINTHCHIDHVFGNKFIADTYNLPLETHKGELVVLDAQMPTAKMYGIPNVELSPRPASYLSEGDVVAFGNTSLEVLFTPGHSPASISFFCKEAKFVIAGDVLFQGSIGRTDLPGGNYDRLIESINTKLLPLGDEVTVYSGHGDPTTIGAERRTNPFLV